MRIPINMSVKGRVTATLTNTETGEKQEIKGDNLILNHYLDWAMTQGLGILGTTAFDRCYIGTGDTPPQPGDTTFNGTQLAVSSSSSLVKNVDSPTTLELIKSFPEIGVGNINQLALTPDNEILLVGNRSATPALKAFKIDKSDWSLTELTVPAFDVFDPELGAAVGLSCGGDYLFVGLSYAPWGKLFKRVGDDFLFIGDVTGLTRYVYHSDISSDGKYLVVCGNVVGSSSSLNTWVYEILENGSLSQLNHNLRGECSAKFSPDCTRLAVANYSYFKLFSLEGGTMTEYYSVDAQFYGGSFPYTFVLRSVGWIDNDYLAVIATSTGSGTGGRLYILHDDSGNVNNVEVLTKTGWGGKINIVAQKILVSSGGFKVSYLGKTWTSGHPNLSVIVRDLGNFGEDIPESMLSSFVLDNESGVMFVRSNGISLYRFRDTTINKYSYSRQWTFPAGTGTGTVNRVGLQANSSTLASGGYNRHVAQIVLPEPLEKTEIHQLDVIWEIEVENPGVWEGVIPGGSRDGSDLNWRITINEEQFYNLVQTGYSIPANWFGTTGTPNVRIGTSNEESDLIFDREHIWGEQIQYISSSAISEVNPYVSGSLKRTIRLFLEVDQGNGQIGEMVLGGSTSSNSLARITFDPPLDKPSDVGEGANPHRIYLDLEIGWQRGESDA